MTAMNSRAVRCLEHLYAILGARERGWAVAAGTVNNRALKLLFKTYARQRAVRLFDNQRGADGAMQLLRRAGCEAAAMEKDGVDKEATPYEEGTRSRLVEMIVAGTTGGAMWGPSVAPWPVSVLFSCGG